MGRNFEKLIEHIINSDEAGARKLFHSIVVNKSRSIYEQIENEGMGYGAEEEMEEGAGDFVDQVNMDHESGGMMEADHEDMVPEDGDDEDMDDEDEDVGDEHMGAEDVEARVDDLESALDDLKAEFSKLMADEDEDEDMDDEDEDMGDEDEDMGDEDEDMGDEDEDMGDEDEDMDDEDEEDMEEGFIREYTENVGTPYKGGKVAGTSEHDVNARSVVAGKNNMGGTAHNLAQGGEAKGRPAPSTKPMSSGKFQNAQGGGSGKPSAGPKAVSKEQSGINKDSVFESRKTVKPSNKKK
jgi:hypothetical protein